MSSDFDVSYRPDPDGRRRVGGLLLLALGVVALVLALLRVATGGTVTVDRAHLETERAAPERQPVACVAVLAGPHEDAPSERDYQRGADDDEPVPVPEDHERLVEIAVADLAARQCDRLRDQRTAQAGVLLTGGLLVLAGGVALRRRA
ncbi:MAG TPA: hypothetical protein VGE77_13650 [Nocardioides sp.]